ncbi:MarR family transcriptional regulator [Cohnella sp. CIP 111063]|uniref:winged helix-turn-helix transcriptional regulator n=1 Tax=unclassified Cohnella TaxID=2636738 RepID=UPI000B8BB4D2|nr:MULTISPECIES: helix-turn-helix domain-containing protein [unclassified Cohnella]OXS53670.1 MarR family transcriptional regulator [Cohnella sp. CIP 111063]PRX61948.1 HxlR family transcriptional regulator [Cohnella sp. SGD-V74]
MEPQVIRYEFNGKQYQCPIELAVSLFSGKWKTTIICKLMEGKKRYGELKKLIVGINHKMLAEQLRELEDAGIISREVYPVVPPKVEYALTELGDQLKPAIQLLQQWGRQFQIPVSVDSPSPVSAQSSADR